MALQFLLTSDLLASLRLDTAPVGWAGMKYLLARDEQYHGVLLTMSAELTFWKQGGAYLRTLYEGGVDQQGVLIPAQGVEANCVLNVYEDDPNNFRTELIYRARFDFLTYRTSEVGVSIKLKELGLATNLLSRASTAVDLLGSNSLSGVALPPFPAATMLLHSQLLRLKYNATQVAAADLSAGYGYGDQNDLSHEQLLYFGFDTPGDNDLGLGAVAGGWVAGDATTVVPIYTMKENGLATVELNLQTHIEAHTTGGPDFTQVDADFYLRIVKGGVVYATRLAPDVSTSGLGGDYTYDLATGDVSVSYQLAVGDSICLYARYFIHGVGGIGTSFRYRVTSTATMQPGSYLRLTVGSTTDPTYCRGLLAHEAFARLTAALADEPNTFYSEYFGRTDSVPAYPQDGPASLRFLTNGFCIRNFPLSTDIPVTSADGLDLRKSLTASFATLYQSLDAQECLGAGFEQRAGRPTLRIEQRAYFYQPTETLRLGAVQGLAKSPDSSLYYNQVQVGYQHWQSGAAVGLDEFNGQHTYTTPLSQVKATYSLLSEVNAGGYLLEQARRQQFVSGTNAEGQADQELFVVCLRRAGSTLATKQAEGYSSVSGILDPDTAYNLDLSPHRMLAKHGFWLRSGLVPQAASGRLALGLVAGNAALVSQQLTEAMAVAEQADVMLTELAPPLFIAENYEFTTRLRRHELRALAARPYGQVSFLDSFGTRRSGYVLKVEVEPATYKAAFTLLRTAA